MIESKSDLTARLRAENRWIEAEEFKNAEIKRLRAEGQLRPEAQAAAWAAMAEKYPPLETPEEDVPEFTPEQFANLPAGSLREFAADASWVYSHLELRDIDTESAPSSGALALLGWARANRDDFYAKILPRALQHQKENPGKEAEASKKAAANRAHRLGLAERLGKMKEGMALERDAIDDLREAKGFEGDTKGFVDYLRGLIAE